MCVVEGVIEWEVVLFGALVNIQCLMLVLVGVEDVVIVFVKLEYFVEYILNV